MFVFSRATFAQFKIPKNPLGALGGDEDKQEEPAGDITQIQATLVNDVADALSEVIEAQALIAEAQGNAEKAASLRVTSDTLKGGENRDEAIQGAVQTVKETAEEQKAVFTASESMSDDSKALYAKALVPYVKSVAKTAKLKDPAMDFLKEAQNEILYDVAKNISFTDKNITNLRLAYNHASNPEFKNMWLKKLNELKKKNDKK